MTTKQTNIRLEVGLRQWFCDLAESEERESTFHMRKALEKYRAEYGQSVPVKPKAQAVAKAVQQDFDPSVFNLPAADIAEIKRIRSKNKGGKITDRVAKELAKQINTAVSAGMTIDEILTEWETRGWKSLKADWLLKDRANSSQGFSARVSELAASRGEAPRGFDAAKPIAGTVINQGGLELGHD